MKGLASPHKGMLIKHMVKTHLAPVTPGGMNYTTVPQSAEESQRNNAIQSFWNGMNYRGNIITRVELPNDAEKGVVGDDRSEQIRRAQAGRQAEFMRQSAMPWGSQFMHTPTDQQRLNNPAQASFVRQRQLTIPNSYGQFYAFMHAMSAAFGNLNIGG